MFSTLLFFWLIDNIQIFFSLFFSIKTHHLVDGGYKAFEVKETIQIVYKWFCKRLNETYKRLTEIRRYTLVGGAYKTSSWNHAYYSCLANELALKFYVSEFYYFVSCSFEFILALFCRRTNVTTSSRNHDFLSRTKAVPLKSKDNKHFK